MLLLNRSYKSIANLVLDLSSHNLQCFFLFTTQRQACGQFIALLNQCSLLLSRQNNLAICTSILNIPIFKYYNTLLQMTWFNKTFPPHSTCDRDQDGFCRQKTRVPISELNLAHFANFKDTAWHTLKLKPMRVSANFSC